MNAGKHDSPEADYDARCQATLCGIEAQVDQWLQDDVIDIDSARTGGLLELSFPDGSRIVVNTQPPLRELWLAAREGGYHYRLDGALWRDTRSGEDFYARLSACASAQGGRALRFVADADAVRA